MKLKLKFNVLIAPLFGLSVLFGALSSSSSIAQTNERQSKAQAIFAERCKTAGTRISRTIDNVEGIRVLKLRPERPNHSDQFAMNDPYGRDLGGKLGYIGSFVRGEFQATHRGIPKEGSPPRLGYLYVEAQDPEDGLWYRYTGSMKVTGRMDASAPNVQVDLKRNPNFDLNVYRFVLDRAPATGQSPRYGVTYDDISTREEREYWIAGSSLKVVDLQTNEVIAERIGYMVDLAQGSKSGGRSPWLFAADNACPKFSDRNGSGAQPYQALDFVEKVLRPAK